VRYFGGKTRNGGKIAKIVNKVANGRPIWEPFCGACGVTQHLDGPVLASDIRPEIIALWHALQEGWVPPENVTESEYYAARDGEGSAAFRAFVGFGCSFGGKWFGGYARGQQSESRAKTERNYAKNARNGLMKKFARVRSVRFETADFFERTPVEPVIYCDPPFAETTWTADQKWSEASFVERCEALAARGHTVLVSGYKAPRAWLSLGIVRLKRGKRLGMGSPTGDSYRYKNDRAEHDNIDPIVDAERVFLVLPSAWTELGRSK
jgi:DNA adenine methylase